MQDQRKERDNASGQEWKQRWAVLQGLSSTNGDVTKESQKYRSTVGKTGFEEGSSQDVDKGTKE